MNETVRLKVERDLARQSASHHIRRERELERLLAGFIALAQRKPRCKCGASLALREMAAELESGDRPRK